MQASISDDSAGKNSLHLWRKTGQAGERILDSGRNLGSHNLLRILSRLSYSLPLRPEKSHKDRVKGEMLRVVGPRERTSKFRQMEWREKDTLPLAN